MKGKTECTLFIEHKCKYSEMTRLISLLFSLLWLQIWLCQRWHALHGFVWSHNWLMSQSMIFLGSTDSKGQARKTGTQRFWGQLNTHLWSFIPPSLVKITHQPTTSPIMSLCMCECMWLARMNLQCVSVYPGARVFMRLNKLSYLPPIRALMSTRNVPFVILGMCYKLRAQGRVIC